MKPKKLFSFKRSPPQLGENRQPATVDTVPTASADIPSRPHPLQGCGFLATLKTIVRPGTPDSRAGVHETRRRISTWNVPNTLVTRWANHSRESYAENVAYGKFMAASIERTAASLASGAISTLDDLWAIARSERLASVLHSKNVGSPAELPQADDREFFAMAGELRGGQLLTTPIKTTRRLRYEYITPTIQRKAHEMFRFKVDKNLWQAGEVTLQRYSVPGDYQLTIASPAEVAGEHRTQVMWSIETSESDGSNSDFSESDSINRMKLINRLELGNVDFTAAPYGAKAFRDSTFYPAAERATQRALAATDHEAVLDHAFEVYWELAMAAPDVRGSAAKAHYVLQSILLSKGIELPPARQGMAPDLEAMARTRPEWVAFARTVFMLRTHPGLSSRG